MKFGDQVSAFVQVGRVDARISIPAAPLTQHPLAGAGILPIIIHQLFF